MSIRKGSTLGENQEFRVRFTELMQKNINEQTEFFVKSFIFSLGDNYKEVVALGEKFKTYLDEKNESLDLNPVQAAEFLQKQGKTRTALQRKEELRDIDLDKNDRIGFTEYLLLHYKIMILKDYFKRKGTNATVDLETDGVGVVGVGELLLEELFTMPLGLDPELERAIEEFVQQKAKKEARLKQLQEIAGQPGVKGLTAVAEINQIKARDNSQEIKLELTLAAKKRKCGGQSAEEALQKKKQEEQRLLEEKRAQSRANLAARASAFNKIAG